MGETSQEGWAGGEPFTSWKYQNKSHVSSSSFFFFRVCDDLSKKEKSKTDEFLEECIIDLSLRQRLSILSRTFENQRKLVQADSMLFLNTIFTIEPLVST